MKYLEFGLSWYGEYAIIWVEKKKKKSNENKGWSVSQAWIGNQIATQPDPLDWDFATCRPTD